MSRSLLEISNLLPFLASYSLLLHPFSQPPRLSSPEIYFLKIVITQHSRHCESAFFATKAISNPAGRWLRFTRHDRHAGCHCERAFFATEAISNPAGRWLRFTRHDRHAGCHCERAFFAIEAISGMLLFQMSIESEIGIKGESIIHFTFK